MYAGWKARTLRVDLPKPKEKRKNENKEDTYAVKLEMGSFIFEKGQMIFYSNPQTFDAEFYFQ